MLRYQQDCAEKQRLEIL